MGKIIQHFLDGYNSPVDFDIMFYILPIILYEDSREKLVKANNRCRLDTLFGKKDIFANDIGCKLSGKVKMSGFLNRYEELKELTGQAIIVLYNEGKIVIDKKVKLIERDNYRNYDGRFKEFLRASYYLGVIFSKTSLEYINDFLGVKAG